MIVCGWRRAGRRDGPCSPRAPEPGPLMARPPKRHTDGYEEQQPDEPAPERPRGRAGPDGARRRLDDDLAVLVALQRCRRAVDDEVLLELLDGLVHRPSRGVVVVAENDQFSHSILL